MIYSFIKFFCYHNIIVFLNFFYFKLNFYYVLIVLMLKLKLKFLKLKKYYFNIFFMVSYRPNYQIQIVHKHIFFLNFLSAQVNNDYWWSHR
jgi:hypothetical protein